MNRIEEMIKEMCPDGVDYKSLSECAETYTGIQLNKSKMQDSGLYAVMNGGIEPSGYYDEFTEENDTITVSQGGASSGYVNWNDSKFWLGAHCYAVHPKNNTNNRYLYHILKEKQRDLMQRAQGAGIPGLNRTALNSITFPLPPLPIQQEIVKILDSFTALQQNLEDELKLRQKQYEHYREKLLTFEEGEVEWKKLGDIASFKYGFTDKAKDSGDTRYVRITDITIDGHLCKDDAKYVELTEESKPYLLKKDDLVMARTGATFGKTLLYQEDYQSIYASFLIRIVFNKDVVVPKYYWIFTKSSHYWLQAYKLVGGGAQPQFNANALAEVSVPIPPLETQHQITQTLDHFESLISNLKTEIELRKKQYEYYREKLLTF